MARDLSLLTCVSALAVGLLGVRSAAASEQRIRIENPAGAPLQDVVVYAVPSTAEPPDGSPPQSGARRTAIIDQVDRHFVPRDSVVQVGTAVDFPNSDNIRHSVYSFSPAKRFSLKLYAGRPAKPIVFDKPGVIVLGCDIHDSMVGWVVVVDTPFFAHTDQRGLATLDLPPGNYALHLWHEPMREASPARPLHVDAAAGSRTLSLQLDPSSEAPQRTPP